MEVGSGVVRSMSGYGCGEARAAGWRVRVEVRSLNHRFLDVALRFPRFCLALEERVRALLERRLQRGRVEVHLTAEPTEDLPRQVRVDRPLARAYWAAWQELCQALGPVLGPADDPAPWRPGPGEVAWIAQLPGVMEAGEAEVDVENVWAAALPALEQALAGVEEMRAAEGERLLADLRDRIARLRDLVAGARERAPQLEEEYRARLTRRLGELAPMLEPVRLAAEAALYAEKVSIHEELVRLGSHLDEMERLLGADEPVGRRLDFLLQEAFREATTMAAKAQDAGISAAAVEIKAELEKMREQGQNVV
ncbi:MAG: YicC/YloC family endoribonuclease [Bacillota bacterium]|nr:YicC/YloC family endoribonuclease [Bacillota bacterium]